MAVGVDISKEMVGEAQSRVTSENATRLSFRQGTVESLRTENVKYDLVVSFSVLEYVEDDLAALDILTSLVKPDGVLVLSVPNKSGLVRKLEGLSFKVRK